MTYKCGMYAIALAAAGLSGCGSGSVAPPSRLVRPASELMVAPAALPDIREGEDIGRYAGKVRGMYGKEARKLRRLQRYVRTVTR